MAVNFSAAWTMLGNLRPCLPFVAKYTLDMSTLAYGDYLDCVTGS